jgi:hypothetical protein
MFSIEIDNAALVKRLQDAHNRVVHFKRVDLGAELSAWQVEELNRHRPFTMRWRAQGRAQTKIRPHSLYEMMKSEGYALGPKEMRRARRALSKHLKHPLPRARKLKLRQHRHWSTRPILRQEMERRLIERMRQAAEEKIHW